MNLLVSDHYPKALPHAAFQTYCKTMMGYGVIDSVHRQAMPILQEQSILFYLSHQSMRWDGYYELVMTTSTTIVILTVTDRLTVYMSMCLLQAEYIFYLNL